MLLNIITAVLDDRINVIGQSGDSLASKCQKPSISDAKHVGTGRHDVKLHRSIVDWKAKAKAEMEKQLILIKQYAAADVASRVRYFKGSAKMLGERAFKVLDKHGKGLEMRSWMG